MRWARLKVLLRKDCAKGLLEIEVSHLDKTLEDMNTYDLEALAATITLVSMEPQLKRVLCSLISCTHAVGGP